MVRKAFKTVGATLAKTAELREDSQSINHSFDAKELTEYERECLQRDVDFDNRILRMKEEIAMQTYKVPNAQHGVVAEELDPMIKNLPHNSVKTKYDVSVDEVAE